MNSDPIATPSPAAPGWKARLGRFVPRGATLRAVVLVVLFTIPLYYIIGGLALNRVDDKLDFDYGAARLEPSQSHAVAMTAALIRREVITHYWLANDPIFSPGYFLDNTPNFQQGLMTALGRFAFELEDQLGRTRGSSQADEDLVEARGLLQYPGDKWILEGDATMLVTASSEGQYKKGRRALLKYQDRLLSGDAVYDKRTDNLLATLDRMALDLGSASAALENHVADHGGGLGLDFGADDLFYDTKGRLYGYAMLLRALERDFSAVIDDKGLRTVWTELQASMDQAATLQPFQVLNPDPDGLFWTNHLTSQGFYLLRARTQLREVTNILLK